MNNNIQEFKEDFDNFTENARKREKKDNLPIFKKRFKTYNPDQITFYTFDPSKTFPIKCFERFIVDTIREIDISDFEKKEACAK